MKRVVLAFLMIATISVAGCTGTDGVWTEVDAAQFAELIDENPNAFLLDVRTQYEWENDGHIEYATLIPHDQIDEQEDSLPDEKDSPILVYCRSGNRSGEAAKSLLSLGYTNVTELDTGINGWKDAGYSVIYGA